MCKKSLKSLEQRYLLYFLQTKIFISCLADLPQIYILNLY
jgi:hypothetical protein